MIYQWFKDGVAIHGQNDSTLVLDNVDLRDFGLYMCYLYYEDSSGEGVESSCATLNVIPQNGKSKYFDVYGSREEDPSTRKILESGSS